MREPDTYASISKLFVAETALFSKINESDSDNTTIHSLRFSRVTLAQAINSGVTLRVFFICFFPPTATPLYLTASTGDTLPNSRKA